MNPYIYTTITSFVVVAVGWIYSKYLGRNYSDIAALQIIAIAFLLLLSVYFFR